MLNHTPLHAVIFGGSHQQQGIPHNGQCQLHSHVYRRDFSLSQMTLMKKIYTSTEGTSPVSLLFTSHLETSSQSSNIWLRVGNSLSKPQLSTLVIQHTKTSVSKLVGIGVTFSQLRENDRFFSQITHGMTWNIHYYIQILPAIPWKLVFMSIHRIL